MIEVTPPFVGFILGELFDVAIVIYAGYRFLANGFSWTFTLVVNFGFLLFWTWVVSLAT